jgi:hypothetical protein
MGHRGLGREGTHPGMRATRAAPGLWPLGCLWQASSPAAPCKDASGPERVGDLPKVTS